MQQYICTDVVQDVALIPLYVKQRAISKPQSPKTKICHCVKRCNEKILEKNYERMFPIKSCLLPQQVKKIPKYIINTYYVCILSYSWYTIWRTKNGSNTKLQLHLTNMTLQAIVCIRGTNNDITTLINIS